MTEMTENVAQARGASPSPPETTPQSKRLARKNKNKKSKHGKEDKTVATTNTAVLQPAAGPSSGDAPEAQAPPTVSTASERGSASGREGEEGKIAGAGEGEGAGAGAATPRRHRRSRRGAREQTSPRAASRSCVIVVVSDDEDDDGDAPSAAPAEICSDSSTGPPTPPSPSLSSPPPPPPPPPPRSAMRLNPEAPKFRPGAEGHPPCPPRPLNPAAKRFVPGPSVVVVNGSNQSPHERRVMDQSCLGPFDDGAPFGETEVLRGYTVPCGWYQYGFSPDEPGKPVFKLSGNWGVISDKVGFVPLLWNSTTCLMGPKLGPR